mmetsp:Transcript_22446/g.57335  ORF Transcript_22446/g.57335 Transcript_22446/m.57335 type:complete len:93 (+) Transcript_22446:538-816(+)
MTTGMPIKNHAAVEHCISGDTSTPFRTTALSDSTDATKKTQMHKWMKQAISKAAVSEHVPRTVGAGAMTKPMFRLLRKDGQKIQYQIGYKKP